MFLNVFPGVAVLFIIVMVKPIEQHPESVTFSRVVNDTGTVASETNGRGYTRAFSYDAMSHLTGIIYPRPL